MSQQADKVQIIFPDNTVHIVEPTELKNLRNRKGFPYPINHVRGVDGIAHSEDNFKLQPGAKYNVSGPGPLEGNRGAPAIIDMKNNASMIDGKSAGTMIVNKKPAATQQESAIVTKTPPSEQKNMRRESISNKIEDTKNMVVDKAKNAKDSIANKAEDTKNAAMNKMENKQGIISDTKNKIVDKTQNAKEAVVGVKDSIANKAEDTKNMIVDKAKDAKDAVVNTIDINKAERVPLDHSEAMLPKSEQKTTVYFKSLAGAPLYKETPRQQRNFLLTFIASIGIGMWAFRKGYYMRKIMNTPNELNKVDYAARASLTPREKDHISQQANKWMLGGLGGVLTPVAYLLYKWRTGGNRIKRAMINNK